MPPPPAEPFAARVFLGPALRAQPDRRLVKLVREGYDGAFEEIVRRYRRPLDRFAAAFVGNRSEDVTQDAFSKALLALRGSEKEIELRPWLYRIVRNTALNDLRDGPPAAAVLGEEAAAGPSAAVEAERREEIAELMARLRALPEPQRAAIVMRELEGPSHEEIAAALGLSGGGARQTIYRARATLRNGFGLLVPLPLLRVLFDQGGEAAAGSAVATAGAGAAAAGSGGAALGGLGAAGALKVGLATAVLAGSVGAGVAVEHNRGGEGRGPATAEAATIADREGSGGAAGPPGGVRPGPTTDDRDGREHGSDDRRRDDDGNRDHGRGSRHGDSSEGHGGGPAAGADGPRQGSERGEPSGHSGSDSGDGSRSGHGPDGSGSDGSGSSGPGGRDRSGDDGSHDGSGSGKESSGSGKNETGSGQSGSGSGGETSHSGDGSGHSGGDTSGGKSGSGSSDDGAEPGPAATPPASEPAPEQPSGSGSGGSGSGSGSGSSGGSGSDSGGSSGGSGDDL